MFLVILIITLVVILIFGLGAFSIICSRKLDKLEDEYFNIQRKEALIRNKLMFINDEVEKLDILKTNPWVVIRKIKETINSAKTIR